MIESFFTPILPLIATLFNAPFGWMDNGYVRFSIRWEENLLESKKRVNQNYVRKGSEYI